jgi:hypothetical protein
MSYHPDIQKPMPAMLEMLPKNKYTAFSVEPMGG